MQGFPHVYTTQAVADPDSVVRICSAGLEDIVTTPPPEFGGPEGNWSPETLLVASVADCFILTFRAIARASKLEWSDLRVEADGTLDRVDNVTQFTRFDLRVKLTLAPGADAAKAEKILHKSEAMCLITNSLKSEVTLQAEVS